MNYKNIQTKNKSLKLSFQQKLCIYCFNHLSENKRKLFECLKHYKLDNLKI